MVYSTLKTGMAITDYAFPRVNKQSFLVVKCWNSNSMGTRGYIKERLELTPIGSFDIEQGGVNSRPGSHGIPEGVRTDGPGFSLCAVPLESSSPGFRDRRVGGMNERRSGVYQTGDDGEG